MGKLIYRDLGLGRLIKGAQDLHGLRVRAGVLGSKAEELTVRGDFTVGEAATINEYGSENANIPARSFVGEPVRQAGAWLQKRLRTSAIRFIREFGAGSGFGNVQFFMDTMGRDMVHLMRATVLNSPPPPNAEFTVKRKGFNRPLYETGQLAEAINFEVIRKEEDYASFEVYEPAGGDE